MPEFVNFYENQKEAIIRLRGTIVMYDQEPFYVSAITNHKNDGVLRIYLSPVGIEVGQRKYCHVLDDIHPEHASLGPALDVWMEANKDAGMLRKRMDSKYFNKFRPFPLGMCNAGTEVYYMERQPLRPKTEQGLIRAMVYETHIHAGSSTGFKAKHTNLDLNGPAFKACILADHPSAETCLSELLDPKVKNEGAAFHRLFAFVRGPIDMIFLAYKEDIIGVLPKNNFDYVRIGRKFAHTKEVVSELGLFNNVVVSA